MASYLDANGTVFWCYETPVLDAEITDNRLRCANLIVDPCTGNGLQGDCPSTPVNNGLVICEQADSWNCNLCSNDLPYFNFVRTTDPFMFQFQQWDYVNGQSPSLNPITGNWGQGKGWFSGMAAVEVKDCCTDTDLVLDVPSIVLNSFVGMYDILDYNGLDKWTNVQQIQLDLQGLYDAAIATNPAWDGCFYLKFMFYNDAFDVINTFYTEPFKFDPCQPDETLFLEGTTSRKDCFGFYYGDFKDPAGNIFGVGTPFQYRNTYRVKGSFELNGFEIQKEVVGVRQTTANTEVTENWQFRTDRLPARVARLISQGILSSETVYVEGRDYIANGTFTKNNDIGNQWFLDSQLKRVQCSKTTSCD